MLEAGQRTNPLTAHGRVRMHSRGFRQSMVEQVLAYGRQIRCRGTVFYVLGRKEVQSLLSEGVDLRCCEGIHVLCNEEGSVVTMYRNHDLSSLHDRRRKRHHHRKNKGRR